MRVLITFLMTLSMWLLYLCDQPAHYRVVKNQVSRFYDSTFYRKDISVRGIRSVSKEEVLANLPLSNSILWWLVNRGSLAARLLNNPLVQEVSVTSCGGLRWGCFVVELRERVPGFIAILGKRAWLVGTDGGMMVPVALSSVELSSLPSSKPPKFPIVQGLAFENQSSDLARARLAKIMVALAAIKEVSKLEVRSIELNDRGEANISFQGLKLQATYDFNTLLASGRGRDEIIDKTKRLNKIVHELGSAIRLVDQIDLVFDKLAVVKPRLFS